MDQTTVGLRDAVKIIKIRRGFIVSMILGSVALALLISFLIPPTYEAETSLRVKQSKGLANSLLGELPTGSFNAKELMLTYAEILKSRAVVQAVIDKMQYGKDEIPEYEDMVRRITTLPMKDTEILRIKVEAASPEEAQLLANTVVGAFYERLVALVRTDQVAVRNFIGERVAESRISLDKEAKALEQYKLERNVLAPADEIEAMVARSISSNKLTAESDVLVAQEIYIMLAKRYEEARISEVMQPTDVQIIDTAIAPVKPIWPKKILNVIIGILIGATTGIGLVFYQEYTNRTINTVEDAKQYIKLPVLGSIPDFDSVVIRPNHRPKHYREYLAG